MFIRNLKVHNFKSIVDTNIELSPLTVFVGANAAGKSNIINVFRFIQNIMVEGLDNAIALQGGIKYISNANLPKGEKIMIGFTVDFENDVWKRLLRNRKIALAIKSIDYQFEIQPNKRGFGYKITYDNVKITYNCYSYDASATKDKKYIDKNAQLVSIYERKSTTSKVKFSQLLEPQNEKENSDEIFNDLTSSFFEFAVNEEKNSLMLSKLSLLLPPSFSFSSFIRIFDFEPKELKKSSSMASLKTLEEDGSNIASVLQTILRNKEQRNRLTLLLQEFLPSIDAISVENNPDKSFSYKIKECYNHNSFYAHFLSDGTVSIIALIIALYFEEDSTVIILEEPERNIHPKLLSNLISAANDVAKEKQIIITTHNPELLKHTDNSCVRLVSRKSNGNTVVNEPLNNKLIASFLKNDLGLEDLFIQGLLEV